MAQHKDLALYEYAKDFLDVNTMPLLDSRKPQLIKIIRDLLTVKLGEEVASGVAGQLGRLPLISTADHHSIIQHPLFVNANIISAIPLVEKPELELNYLVVLSFASVSVNNTSGYARGIIFHSQPEAEGRVYRLPILPDKMKMGTVYGMHAYSRLEVERLLKRIRSQAYRGFVSPAVAESLEKIN
ncbi:hypothetical protein A3H09_02770 [Candidatus Falkowbacteria bacterium RIFCSPLOWO2_12_FULL_45_13]|uniref:Uncharacterized protein n=2 Tax=Candidatus Falkowiibacteriota TaxID=1752728 RepID=A0A1F5SDD7_9BACT|nr:MAG: hypothetical protein A3H66_02040 [Candidatus Falkowbacteria bacterium RIFCSPLOWO2_02_FULL_45_21]OGF29872.1 MAG: hypothetical protein A3H09_02770 [Candidatus Falkowbacteria bacterium RIFCSPLOWO2_12_FULL_45_13]